MTELEEARILATLAGVSVTPEREATLASGLALTKRIAESLATVGLGIAEPAAVFRAPAARNQ